MSKNIVKIIKSLNRISTSIDNINPETKSFENKIFEESKYFIWNTDNKNFRPIFNVNRIDLQLLIGIDNAKNTLIENTLHFAKGFNANNVLLWGSRGMGKSSLVKAVHYKINNEVNNDLIDIGYLTLLYKSNMIANFHINWLSPVKVRKILIGGTKKMIVFNYIFYY